MRTHMAVVLACLLAALAPAQHALADSYSILFDDAHDSDGDELGGDLSGFVSLLASNDIAVVEFNGSPGDLGPAVLAGTTPCSFTMPNSLTRWPRSTPFIALS